MIRMVRYKLRYDKPGCIGCGACVSIAPGFWKMDEEAGKAVIVGGRELEDGTEELEIEEKDVAINEEAAQACPVSVISVEKIEDAPEAAEERSEKKDKGRGKSEKKSEDKKSEGDKDWKR